MVKVVRDPIQPHVFNRLVTCEKNPEMMESEFGVIALEKGDTFRIDTHDSEYVLCLNEGKVEFQWNTGTATVERLDCFHHDPVVLHLCKGSTVLITCKSDYCEVNVANTENDKLFPCKLYLPKDLMECGVVDKEKLGGKLTRIKRVFFDRTTCPESNLFCGEVVNYPGCWACFPPHLHFEPEIYYYKFLPENGYGFSEYNDEAFKVKNHNVMCIPREHRHSQVTAPGYGGYIMWTQRLQNNGKNIVYRLDPEQAWLEDPCVKVFPEEK